MEPAIPRPKACLDLPEQEASKARCQEEQQGKQQDTVDLRPQVDPGLALGPHSSWQVDLRPQLISQLV
jgi:hypothetical protein